MLVGRGVGGLLHPELGLGFPTEALGLLRVLSCPGLQHWNRQGRGLAWEILACARHVLTLAQAVSDRLFHLQTRPAPWYRPTCPSRTPSVPVLPGLSLLQGGRRRRGVGGPEDKPALGLPWRPVPLPCPDQTEGGGSNRNVRERALAGSVLPSPF